MSSSLASSTASPLAVADSSEELISNRNKHANINNCEDDNGHTQFAIDDDQQCTNSRLWFVFLCVIVVCFGAIEFGLALAFTSNIGEDIAKDFNKSDDNNFISFFASLVNIGALIGSSLAGVIAEFTGRRGALMIATLPLISGWAAISWANGSLTALYFGRILTGVGIGISSLCVPVYIAEIAPANLRGGLGSTNQLCITIGVLLAYVFAPDRGVGLSWQWIARFGMILACVMFGFLLLIPESPRWLIKHQNLAMARKSLRRLRGKSYNVEMEIKSMEASLQQDSTVETGFRGFASVLSSKNTVRPLIIGVSLMVIAQFSGINAVIAYTNKIFTFANVKNPNLATIGVGISQVVVTCFSCFIVDRVGRRILLLVACSGQCVCLFVLGILFTLVRSEAAPNVGIYSIISLVLYMAFFSIGMGSIPWVIMSEIFPLKSRAIAAGITTFSCWLFAYIVTVTFSHMANAFKENGVFFFYGCVCLLGFAFIFIKVPETKGKTLEDIEVFFKGGISGSSRLDNC